MNCPGSVAMAQKVPVPPPSEFAAEGTKCHELSEMLLLPLVYVYNKNPAKPPKFVRCKDLPKDALIQNYPRDMKEYAEDYVSLLWDSILANKPKKVFVEQKVHLSKELKMYGMADVFFGYAKKKKTVLEVWDLKYGKGKLVEADSQQLIYYALAIQETYPKSTVDEFHLNVYQPRADHPDGIHRVHVLRKEQAKTQREGLINGAKLALDMVAGKTPIRLVAGDHCGFCAAKAVCTAYTAHINKEAGMDFANGTADFVPAVRGDEKLHPELFLSDKQAVRIIRYKPAIEKFLSAVLEYGMNRYNEGRPLEGTKVVRGRANRKWQDATTEVVRTLQELGIEDPYDKKLRGLGSVERELIQLGKATGKTKKDKEASARKLIDPIVTRHEASLSLVFEDDPRPAFNINAAASSDFTSISADSASDGDEELD